MRAQISVGSIQIKRLATLAPMAGVTDQPFRRQAREYGAGLVTSEMIAAQEFASGRAAVKAKAALGAWERGASAVQIAGRDARAVAETARAAEAEGAAMIDLNFGCPAKKVTGGLAGSALMREPKRALGLIEAAAGAVSLPVTVKMRLGWDDAHLNAPEIAASAENAGVAMIAVHGRTRQQFYKGAANWDAVRAVVERVSTPVLVNGDIDGPAAAREALRRAGAAGVMIGRAAQGRPWLVGEIAAALAGEAFAPPGMATRWRLAIAHYDALLTLYGREVGARVARKHLGWRLEHMGAHLDAAARAALRARLVRLDDAEAVLAALRDEADRAAAADDWASAA